MKIIQGQENVVVMMIIKQKKIAVQPVSFISNRVSDDNMIMKLGLVKGHAILKFKMINAVTIKIELDYDQLKELKELIDINEDEIPKTSLDDILNT